MNAARIERTPVRRLSVVGSVCLAAVLLLFGSARAHADFALGISSVSNTLVQPGGQLTYIVEIVNAGTSSSDGTPITLTATLAPRMTGVSTDTTFTSGAFTCDPAAGATVIRCTGSPVLTTVLGFNNPKIAITADVPLDAPGLLTSTFQVEGGGAAVPAQTADPVTVTLAAPVFEIDGFDAEATKLGSPLTQAGGHPDRLSTVLDFTARTDPRGFIGEPMPIEDVKDITVELPPGLVGSTTGLGECTQPELATGAFDPRPMCPETSQVGLAVVQHGVGTFGPVPVFNMVPPPGVPARFGFNVSGSVVVLDAHVRPGDHGIGVTASNIPQALTVIGSTVTLWGVPSDESHDAQRACHGELNPSAGGPVCRTGGERKAFFRLPTSCSLPGEVVTTASASSWQDEDSDHIVSKSVGGHEAPGYPFPRDSWGDPLGIDGCNRVPFTPTLDARPSADAKAGAPSGFGFDLTLPQTDNPDTPAGQSDLRTATVMLPQGVRVNPSSAGGLGACSSAQIALGSAAAPSCPDNSKLATVTIDTPLLDVPVTGNVFLAKPFDNPFNSLIAMYIVASAKGVVIKLPGQATMNVDTGQITATFDDNPQLPFNSFHLEFRGGPRAPITLPRRCGTYTTEAVLTGWNGRTVVQSSSFTLNENARGRRCPREFAPGFSAGTESNSAGSHSSFLLRLTREDEDEEFDSLRVKLPGGLTGKIASADLCTDDQVSKDACPANSKIGDVVTGAGAGGNPFFITNGRAYLTGPYRPVGSSETAPFGVAIVVPAVAGPFDLGKVTVRSALFVDEKTAEVSIVSDPFPRILQGIPLDIRDVRVNVNKRRFFLNPTSCAQKSVTGTVVSTEGSRASVSDRFQAADCASLGFKPRMVMRVGGRGHTRRGRTSPFTTRLTMPSRNQTNIRFVRVTLPRIINARLNTINDACTRAEFESDLARCAHAKAGTAVASTPLLRRPLRGNVYFVKNGNPIPDLFVALRGQVSFDLVGRISIVNNVRLRTTFATAPDVPIRSFTLRLLGGPRTASIGAAANLCSASSRAATAEVDYIGQNGKVRQVDQKLKVGGCAQGGSARRGR